MNGKIKYLTRIIERASRMIASVVATDEAVDLTYQMNMLRADIESLGNAIRRSGQS